MYILSDTSRSTIMLVLIALLLIFIFITLFYVLFVQKRQGDILRRSLKQDDIDEDYKEKSDLEEKEIVKTVKVPDDNNVNNWEMELPIYKDENKKSNLDETRELKNITESLESLPQERKIDMTPYEAEQEEKAIISYDELISKKNYGDISDREEYESIDLNKDKQREMNLKGELNDYKHEEEFLETLKKLEEMLM